MATTEQFSLRWNNFHSNLTTGFHDLLEASDLVDVTLAVDGRFLLAHKIVLSICSPYFKEMFKMNPCKHPIVILKDVSHENLKDILEFMYVGEVNVLRENLPSFLRTAELLQVKGLTGDDSQSETSSKKDEKQDSICDEQEEDHELTQMFEAENLRLPQYSPDLNVPSQKTQQNKRNARQTLNTNSTKRTKNDNNNVNRPSKCVIEEDMVPERANIKSESVYDFDEQKEAIKSFEANSLNYGTDTNMQDHDSIMFTIDEKGHAYCPYCFKKFVNRYNLKVHIRDKHDTGSTNLNCVVCGKTMRNRSCLRVHMYHHRKQQEMLKIKENSLNVSLEN